MPQFVMMFLLAFISIPVDAGMTKLVNLTVMPPQKNSCGGNSFEVYFIG